MWLVNISLLFLVGLLCVQVRLFSLCSDVTPMVYYCPEERMCHSVRDRYLCSQINSHTWLYSGSHVTGPNTNKCNIFVADVLKHEGADAPNRWPFFYTPIGAEEWGNPRSSYLNHDLCWELCTLPTKSLGDVISDGVHVGIVTGIGQTTSASSEATPNGLVVENEWGFGETDNPTCWRYQYNRRGCWT